MESQGQPKQGIIYCATGKKYINEAEISVKSLRDYNHDLNVSIFIDDLNFLNKESDLFNSIHVIKNPEYSFGDKISTIENTPYEKTIFLDTDTIIADDISELFHILKRYDMAIAHIPLKNRKYPEFNTGVIAYNLNHRTKKFFRLWNENYDRATHNNDQISFLMTMSNTSISTFILPPKYNFRIPIASYVQDKIKIFHSRNVIHMNPTERETILNLLNESYKERFWFPGRGILKFQEEENIFSNLLLFIEEKIFQKIGKSVWNSSKMIKLKKKLCQFYFPMLINWAVPKNYRDNIKLSNNNIRKFS